MQWVVLRPLSEGASVRLPLFHTAHAPVRHPVVSVPVHGLWCAPVRCRSTRLCAKHDAPVCIQTIAHCCCCLTNQPSSTTFYIQTSMTALFFPMTHRSKVQWFIRCSYKAAAGTAVHHACQVNKSECTALHCPCTHCCCLVTWWV